MASASLLSHILIPLFFFLPLIHFFHPTAANTYTNITLGSTLTPLGSNVSWPSPSGDFAIGFRPVDPSNSSSLFLLAVWFEKTANSTIVWSANRNNPVPSGSKFVLTTNGQLILNDPSSQVVWKSDATGASHAAILDSGNLVLVDSDSSIAWQSFDSPTDTILLSQVLSMGTKLWSRLTDTDYSDGRFQFDVQTDGNVVSYSVSVSTGYQYPAYWASGTQYSETQLVFNDSGILYVTYTNGSLVTNIWSTGFSSGDFYQRATLDPDGALRHYVYPKNGTAGARGSWAERWNIVDVFPDADICSAITIDSGSGICGPNSYCMIDKNQMSECRCPTQYSFIDPSRKYKGCMPDFPAHTCEADDTDAKDEFVLLEMTNTDWPGSGSDYDRLGQLDENQCRESCLSDCFCAVVTHTNSGDCEKKKLPLSNGRRDASIGSKSLIKVPKANNTITSLSNICKPQPPIPIEEKQNRRTLILVVSSLLGGSVLINLLFIAAIFLSIFSSNNRRAQKTEQVSSMGGLSLRLFTYKELEEATKGFSEELGSGAFGTVYKGVLGSETRAYIAVKKLHNLLQETEKEFSNEVRSIGLTHHKNLVTLVGFCNEGTHRLLVYEYMRNGSLTGFLFGISRPDWNQRIQIALGIARGLLYLHEDCRSQIIHCDIKPSNILLDDKFVARISDFGMAKLLRADQTRTSTGIKGTKGYVAPEWFKGIAITAKVDVYSFGIVLLEIICCRQNLKLGTENEDEAVLTDWAYDCYRHGRMDLLVETDEEAMFDLRRWERFMRVAIWCIQEDPMLRPSMQKVTQMLDGAAEVPVPPDPSSFLSSIQ